MLGIEETVIGVLVSGKTNTGEIVVVNPDLGRLVNIDQILALRCPVEL